MGFKEIKGQDNAIDALKGYLRNGRAVSGYLFIGPEGVGKFLTAKTLAKAVNCFEANLDPCDNCAPCRKIEKNQHPDVHIIDTTQSRSVDPAVSFIQEEPDRDSYAFEKQIDTENNSPAIKIEHIRELQKDINLRPYEAQKKVFIINDAHNLTAEASNALLKTLEEPPGDSLIILVTAKPTLLFKTVISRCKIIKFYPLPRNQLQEIMKADYLLDDGLAHFLAYFSEGRIGSALRLKDTDILREKNKIIDEVILQKSAGFDNRPGPARQELRRYLNIAATWFRDIYLIKIGLPHSQLINFDRKDELVRASEFYSLSALDEIFRFVSDSLLYLEQNINPKLLLSNLKWSVKH